MPRASEARQVQALAGNRPQRSLMAGIMGHIPPEKSRHAVTMTTGA